jgi:hypothetical protein
MTEEAIASSATSQARRRSDTRKQKNRHEEIASCRTSAAKQPLTPDTNQRQQE